MKSRLLFAFISGMCVSACSQTNGESKDGASPEIANTEFPTTPAREAQTLETLGVVAMNKLNDCVAKEVTTLVNSIQGNVDAQSTSDIAAKAVDRCDHFVDDAANEQISTLKAAVADPAEFKQKAEMRKQLESRTFADWRKSAINMKIAFAKTYVGIVADRFNRQLEQQDKSGSSIAPNK